ncbi:MAG: MATE family efflux transporter [Planctomycetes bacterium]|nr:MATE family efflux transporter [Planctomycetota bacterium]
MSQHAFDQRPNRTLLVLSVPVLLSLIAEPLTALVDTAFVSKLGDGPMAALGVGTTLLSAIFWIFNFLSIGIQSEVARFVGAGQLDRARAQNAIALTLAGGFGLGMLAFGWPLAPWLAEVMGAEAATADDAVIYFRIRLFAAPAVLLTATAFGSLRGLQNMRVPMGIALLVNALNIGLDAVLILGAGPIPAYGIAGAAWATLAAQWIGCFCALFAVFQSLGRPAKLSLKGASQLLQVGSDMFVRTGLLTLFLILATRAATRMGDEAGAAHHAIRQVWLFTALALDALAVSAQSLVGWYLGKGRVEGARRVAGVCCGWSFGMGLALAIGMLLGEGWVAQLLVPIEAQALFTTAWLWGAWAQPLNALCFATDGLHWGTRDYRYLRNVMILASGLGWFGLQLIDPEHPGALESIWLVTGAWILVRASFGMLRIWPGIGASPFRSSL